LSYRRTLCGINSARHSTCPALKRRDSCWVH